MTPLHRFSHRLWVCLFALGGLLVLGGCAALDHKQRQWIFQPSDRTWSQGVAAAEGMADVWLPFQSKVTGAPAKLHALWLPHARADAPVLLYLHGARWDVRGSAHRMRNLAGLGFSVLGVDYRGFGRSEGGSPPSEDMALEDAQAAWAWLRQRAPNTKRFVFGHSLGGTLAVRLAAQASDVSGLIVEGSFPSIPDLVSTFPWGWLPVSPLITQRFEAWRWMPQVKAPVLVVHGESDRLVPPELGRALYGHAPGAKRFVLVPSGTHHNTNWVGRELYREAVGDLFGLPVAPLS